MSEGVVRFRVRYAETDQMGVVYHPNYLVWCEIGRTELMRRLGFPYAAIERHGTLLAVAEATVRYGRAARYDDCIRVVTRIVAVQSRAVTFSYRILRENGDTHDPLATATTRLIAMDATGASKRMPSQLLQRLREHLSPE